MVNKWHVLNQKFLEDHFTTGISVKDWCEISNLNYNTARRHIKKQTKVAQSLERNRDSGKSVKRAQSTVITKLKSKQIQPVTIVLVEGEEHCSPEENASTKKRTSSLGNQNARTYGHYSEFITTDTDEQRYSSASLTTLREELNLMRMQLSNLMDAIKDVEACLRGDVAAKEKVTLHESYTKYQTIFNVKIARIESLENSLVSQEKMKADIEKTIALTRKAKLEADKLNRESDSGTNVLEDIYEDILAMDNDGMLSQS